MADRARCDLPYGHFGRAVYSLDDHRWHFERALAFSSNTQQLAEPKIVSNPSNTAAYNHRERDQGPVSLRHQKQIKAIVDITPHLRPASNIISPLLQVSEVAQEAVRRNDPLKASLIAFGDIQSHSRNRPISVAAYATGSTGCDLCIVQVQKQKRGWFDDRSSWLEVPTLRGGQPTWSSRGGTIQQVHFASKSRPGPDLLAVRLLAGTTIIRAVQDKTPSEEASGFSISSTTLHNVEIRQTGGHTHVDVAFNPWFSQQVALVDIAGNWTVLEFSARNMLQVAHTWSGLARKTSDEKVSPITDGWARIAWVMSLGILAVCTRQCLNLFSIAGGDPTLVEEVELGLSGAVPWVLDFAVLPGHLDHFCVLTSTHVMVYKAVEKTSSKKIARIKFNTRHYKNPEDLSLRLAMWTEEGEEDVGILIYSNLLGLVSCYRLTLSETHPAMTAEHMDIPVPTTHVNATQPCTIVSVEIQRVEMVHKPTARDSDRHFRGARFYTALIAREGTGVCQTLFCTGADAVIPSFAWEAKLANSSFKLRRPQFLIEDSLLDREDIANRRVEPSARRSRQAKTQPARNTQTVGLEQVANLLQSPIGSTEPFADVLTFVHSELERSDLEIVTPMRTLHSFAQAELDVGDVEACSSALARLESFQNVRADGSPEPASGDVENTHRLALAPVDIPSSLGLEDLRLDTGLSSVYDCTLATWVTPLSENIPGRIRLAKAKLCGLVSAQLVLASQSLRIEEPPEMQPAEEDTQTQTQSQDPHSQTLQLPSHQFGINRGFTFSQLASSQPFPSSALPTPSQTNTPSQTPSITTASTHTTLFSAPEPHRLSKFTTFTKPPPPALPRSLANILSHWTPGENLETYDWMSTARVLAQQDEDANEEMTETERRRAQRRAERHLKRQRKEAAASQAREVASSQAPAIFSQPPRGVESQPLSGMPPASSQFTAVGGTGVTSQVEAGRFGGRPGPSAAAAAGVAGKKRRRQGF